MEPDCILYLITAMVTAVGSTTIPAVTSFVTYGLHEGTPFGVTGTVVPSGPPSGQELGTLPSAEPQDEEWTPLEPAGLEADSQIPEFEKWMEPEEVEVKPEELGIDEYDSGALRPEIQGQAMVLYEAWREDRTGCRPPKP